MDIKISLDRETLEKVMVLIESLGELNENLSDLKTMIADRLGWVVK
ncbi:MAG: hypothetical protein DDT19_01729 [Syntrophomonadaceae bacterium]|nr:hypothetical protein [Bacillota bacterium]